MKMINIANRNKQLKKSKVAIASLWYLICNIVMKGMAFFTTPFFSRILTKEEYGLYSNFSTWVALVTIVATLSLRATLLRARFDYKDDFYEYIFSMLILGSAFTFLVFMCIFSNSVFFTNVFVVDNQYLVIMFLTIIVSPAYEMFLDDQRYQYKYKTIVILTISVFLVSIGLSFVLIDIMADNLLARVIGAYLPSFVVAVVIYLRYFVKAKTVKVKYWKYALPIAIPYIFHLLSGNILSSSDKTMITKICGASENALYSMAYNIAMIVNVIWSSLNSAFAPWMTEKINRKEYDIIKRVSYSYILVFSFMLIGVMLLAPEALLVLGGNSYENAIYVIPPVMYSYFFMLIYSLYVNIEQYEKKTLGMAFATAIAAGINIILNSIFVPIFGYIAAAYTTLTGYVLLTIIHYFLVKRIGLEFILDTRFILICMCGVGAITCVIYFLYSFILIRWGVIVIYLLLFAFLVFKNKEKIISVLKK